MKIFTLIFLSLILFGCGGGSDDTSQQSDSDVIVAPIPDDTVDPDPVDTVDIVIASAFDDGSSHANYPPANAIDGNLDLESRWAAQGSPVELTIQLQEVSLISKVGIAWAGGDTRSSTFEIYTRTDTSGDWALVYNNDSSGTTAGMEYYEFTEVTALQILIKGLANSDGSSWINILEVDVKGSSSADEGSTGTDNSGPGYAGEWTKTRLYGHSYNSGDFTDEEYDWIRDNFEYFTVEKTHLRSIYGNPSHELTSQITATKLLEANPKVKPLMIYSVGSGYPSLFESEAEILLSNPEYFTYDVNGDVDELNLVNSGENDWYIETTNRITENSDLVGIFLDGFKSAHTSYPENVQYISNNMTGFRLVNGMDFAPSGLEIRSWPESLDYSDGVFIDSFFRRRVMSADAGVVLLDALINDMPKDHMFVAFSAYDGYSTTYEFSHAAYLIVANDNAYYRWVDEGDHLWSSESLMTWYDVFDKEMGEPLGDAVKDGYVYTRVFEHCTVTIDVENITSHITWDQNNTAWDSTTGIVTSTDPVTVDPVIDEPVEIEDPVAPVTDEPNETEDPVVDEPNDTGSSYDYAYKSNGIFVHYGWGGTEETDYGCQITQYADGTYPQSLDEAANNFDVQGFVNDIAAMSPEYLIFTAWHCGMNPLYPSVVMDKWVGEGQSSQRDVLQELLDAAEAKGIDVYFYTQPSAANSKSPTSQALVDFTSNSKYSETYNDFINELYTEMTERYKTQLKGYWFDKGLGFGSVDSPRLGATIKAILPNAVMIKNGFASDAPEAADFGAVEIMSVTTNFEGEGYDEADDADVETWPAFERSMSFVSDRAWSSQSGSLRYTSEQMYKYTVLEAGVNEEGGGVAWALGPFPTTTISWNTGVLSGMTELGAMIDAVGESIKGTAPSDSWPTAEGTRIQELEWGVATRSADGNYEYLHVLNSPSEITLTIAAPADGREYTSAINLRTGNACSFSQTASQITISLSAEDSWDSVDTVIKLE